MLQREGSSRRYFYRFSDPILQPYVVLAGLADGLITDAQLRRFQTQQQKAVRSPASSKAAGRHRCFEPWEQRHHGTDQHQVSLPGTARLSGVLTPFKNEPILELRRGPVRAQLHGALEAFDAEPVIQVPVWVGDGTRNGGALLSVDPGEPERVVAQSAVASEADVDEALTLAGEQRVEDTSATHRAEVLIRAAAWLRVRRLEIAALEVRETAKPWREADGDVCEAIDFLEYYARAAIALSEHPAGLPGRPAPT